MFLVISEKIHYCPFPLEKILPTPMILWCPHWLSSAIGRQGMVEIASEPVQFVWLFLERCFSNVLSLRTLWLHLKLWWTPSFFSTFFPFLRK